jgi:hypothetical protein
MLVAIEWCSSDETIRISNICVCVRPHSQAKAELKVKFIKAEDVGHFPIWIFLLKPHCVSTHTLRHGHIEVAADATVVAAQSIVFPYTMPRF